MHVKGVHPDKQRVREAVWQRAPSRTTPPAAQPRGSACPACVDSGSRAAWAGGGQRPSAPGQRLGTHQPHVASTAPRRRKSTATAEKTVSSVWSAASAQAYPAGHCNARYSRVPAPPPRITAATLLEATFSCRGGERGQASALSGQAGARAVRGASWAAAAACATTLGTRSERRRGQQRPERSTAAPRSSELREPSAGSCAVCAENIVKTGPALSARGGALKLFQIPDVRHFKSSRCSLDRARPALMCAHRLFATCTVHGLCGIVRRRFVCKSGVRFGSNRGRQRDCLILAGSAR